MQKDHLTNKDTIHKRMVLFFNAPKNPIIELKSKEQEHVSVIPYTNNVIEGFLISKLKSYIMKMNAPRHRTGRVRDLRQLSL